MLLRLSIRVVTENVDVSDSETPMFEWASELSGGTPLVVVAGLKLFAAQHERERKQVEMGSFELEVQTGPVVKT